MKLKNDLNEKLRQIESEKAILSTEIDCLKRELREKSSELNIERIKLDNLIRSEQSLKLKYESSLESVDKLTVDIDELKIKNIKINEETRNLLDEIKLKNVMILK
jgi:hypothetical protein